MRIKSLSIPNRSGQVLSARIDIPGTGASAQPPPPVAIYAHCFTCSKNIKAAANLSRGLVARGLAVCRFDFTGLGESSGRFADTTFTSNVTDLIDVAAFLEREYAVPRLLIGHSLGGAAALQAALQLSGVRAVVTIGAPFDPRHVLRHLSDLRQRIEDEGEASVTIESRTFHFKADFIDDLETIDPAVTIRNLNRPLLVMHAPQDDTVSIDHAGWIFKTARHPKSFVCLDGADHLLSQSDQARYAGELIAAWASKYIRTAGDK
jgi:pimeloyl-ACP methyl ester carboxylesterase